MTIKSVLPHFNPREAVPLGSSSTRPVGSQNFVPEVTFVHAFLTCETGSIADVGCKKIGAFCICRQIYQLKSVSVGKINQLKSVSVGK